MEAIIDYCLFCSMLNRLLSLNLITNDEYRLLSEMLHKKIKNSTNVSTKLADKRAVKSTLRGG